MFRSAGGGGRIGPIYAVEFFAMYTKIVYVYNY